MSRLIIGQITIKKERAISSTKWYYLLQPANANPPDKTNYGNPPPTITQTGYSGWSETEPSYTVGDDRKLYEMVLTVYTDGTFEYTTPSVSSSYEASKAAYAEIVQAQNTIAEFEDLGLKQGYIWDNMTYVAAHNNIPVYPVGSYIASGIVVEGQRSITRTNSNTYGLNTWISTGGINLRYNAIDLMKLTTSNLEFYYPSTSSQQKKAISLGTNNAINSLAFYGFNSDNKTMELTNSGLFFYNPINGTTIYATLDINGLKLAKGGIEAGTAGQSGFIYLSTDPYGTYTIHNSTQTDWKQIIGTNFGVRADGSIYASSGLIGGWTISNESYFITADTSYQNNKTYYIKNNNDYIEFTGNTFDAETSYYEKNNVNSLNTGEFNQPGGVYISSSFPGPLSIADVDDEYLNWTIVAGQNFGVTTNGVLYAANANISGTINANYGEIGGFTIAEEFLSSNGKTDVVSTNQGTYIGPLGFNISGGTKETTVYFSENAVSIGGLLEWSSEGTLTIHTDDLYVGNIAVKSSIDDIQTINTEQTQAISSNTTHIAIVENFLDDYYKPYITTTTNNASGYIQLKRKANNDASSIKITDSIIELSINQNNITTYSGNLMHTTFGEFENLRMRVGTTGSLTWIARSNGHLSLKVVN